MSAKAYSQRQKPYSPEQRAAALLLVAAHQTTTHNEKWRTISGWREWVTTLFPSYVRAPFAQRHVSLWEWAWSIKPNERPCPFIAAWPRGGGKSVTAELVACALGLRRARKYALYVCNTQDQADDHVSSIGARLEEIGVERAINKYGSSRGWRRNRLRAADGFTIDALGLDTAARGIRIDEQRPDLIILDDIDSLEDSSVTIQRKIDRLTNTVLPTGSRDCAVLGAQNLIHANSIFSRLVENRVDFLSDRIVSGPFVALEDFAYEQTPAGVVITRGVPTWAGQDVAACQNMIRNAGLRAFKRECQHMTKEDVLGALWTRKSIEMFRLTVAPELTMRAVALDPSTTSKDSSDECGIVAGGRDKFMHGFVLGDYTLRGTPSQWATRAISVAIIHDADHIVYEDNQGGDMVATVLRGITLESIADDLEHLGYPRDKARAGSQFMILPVHASRGKETRAEPTSSKYALGQVHHVGVFPALEDEQCTWIPGTGRSPNRVDALVWLMTDLLIGAVDLDEWTNAYREAAKQAGADAGLTYPMPDLPGGVQSAQNPLGNYPFRVGG